MSGVETVLWTTARTAAGTAAANKGDKWCQRVLVLEAAERVMDRWHKKKAERSRLRYASESIMGVEWKRHEGGVRVG